MNFAARTEYNRLFRDARSECSSFDRGTDHAARTAAYRLPWQYHSAFTGARTYHLDPMVSDGRYVRIVREAIDNGWTNLRTGRLDRYRTFLAVHAGFRPPLP